MAAAANPRIHTFLSTSPIHMRHKLKKEPDEVLAMAVKAVKYARNKVAEVEFSPEDATRTEPDFLCRVVEAVIGAGATIINIPDTVGYTVPDEFAATIRLLRERVPNIDKAIISVHCHNDLGLAVANTLAAIAAGARQAEVTVNGIGERAGNASLEEVVMALKVRRDLFGADTRVQTTQIWQTSRLLSSTIGFPIARNKAIVGENAFAHESGIHQDGMLKNRQTYEIMTPESVGRNDSKIVLGRHSGMHGFKTRLAELGISLAPAEQEHAYQRFLAVADRKKEIFDEDLFAIAGDESGGGQAVWQLEYFTIFSGNQAVPTATVRISAPDDSPGAPAGTRRLVEEAATGDGPVDAIFRAIDRALERKASLVEYTVQAVTPGRQAMGEVTVMLEIGGRRATGHGSSTDILEASGRAYLNAYNRHQLSASYKSAQEMTE
jgi:2-isopropylmalate synthase